MSARATVSTVLVVAAALASCLCGAGCDDEGAPAVVSLRGALKSCTAATDCPVPGGACLVPVCSGTVCDVQLNPTACPTGCSSPGQCDDGNPCTDDDCQAGACVHAPLGSPSGDGGAPEGCCGSASVALDCAAPNSCQQTATCQSGSCTYQSNASSLLCCDGASDCGGTAICSDNQCQCPTSGEKLCLGAAAGQARCVPQSGCCVAGDCPPVANAIASCSLAGDCQYACTGSFGDCSGGLGDGCETDLSSHPEHCGSCLSSCPDGSTCELPVCVSSGCGLVSVGLPGCCTDVDECIAPGPCQLVSCEEHTCTYEARQVSGCCTVPADCPPTGDECIERTCTENLCGTRVDLTCVGDAGVLDLSTVDADALDAGVPDESDMTPVAPGLTGLSVGGGSGCSYAPDASRASLAWLLVPLVAVLFRRPRRWSRRAGLAAVALVAVSSVADAAEPGIDAQLFHPTATARGFFSVDGAMALPHLAFSAGLFVSYARNPLVARCAGVELDAATGTSVGCAPTGAIAPGGRLVAHQLSMELVASLGLLERLEIALALPFVPYQRVSTSLYEGTAPSSLGIGDVRVEVKGLLHSGTVGRAHRLGLSLLAGFSAPSGRSDSYLSFGWTGRVLLVGEWSSRWVGLALNFGGHLRSEHRLGDLVVGHQLRYGLAGRVALGGGVDVLAEVAGLIGVGLPEGRHLTSREAPGEQLGGLRWRARFGLELSASTGTGLTAGYGAADVRAVLGVRYASTGRDAG